MTPIVLASASPRRMALLRALGLEIRVVRSRVPETSEGEPEILVGENAKSKRDDVAGRLDQEAIVIGADTVVALDGRVMGKPADHEEAAFMLAHLSGKSHTVYTGVAIIDMVSGETAQGVEKTGVTFVDLAQAEIDRFIQVVNPVDRAGGYTSDGPGSLLIEGFDGCYYNVLGLPIVLLNRLFHEIGDDLFARIDRSQAQFL